MIKIIYQLNLDTKHQINLYIIIISITIYFIKKHYYSVLLQCHKININIILY